MEPPETPTCKCEGVDECLCGSVPVVVPRGHLLLGNSDASSSDDPDRDEEEQKEVDDENPPCSVVENEDPEAPQSAAQTKRQRSLECPWMTWYSHPRRPGSRDSL